MSDFFNNPTFWWTFDHGFIEDFIPLFNDIELKFAAQYYKPYDQTPKAKKPSTGHFRHRRFNEAFDKLPPDVQRKATQNFQNLLRDPMSVGFKPMPGLGGGNLYSAQIGARYRALAVKTGEGYVWYWIGSHEDYNHQKKMPMPQIGSLTPQRA